VVLLSSLCLVLLLAATFQQVAGQTFTQLFDSQTAFSNTQGANQFYYKYRTSLGATPVVFESANANGTWTSVNLHFLCLWQAH